MVTTAWPEDVGGICVVCTHPAYSGYGIATRVLVKAHHRMLAAGLRYSTLGTTHYRTAHRLYRRLGYEDVYTPLTTFAVKTMLSTDPGLHVDRAG